MCGYLSTMIQQCSLGKPWIFCCPGCEKGSEWISVPSTCLAYTEQAASSSHNNILGLGQTICVSSISYSPALSHSRMLPWLLTVGLEVRKTSCSMQA